MKRIFNTVKYGFLFLLAGVCVGIQAMEQSETNIQVLESVEEEDIFSLKELIDKIKSLNVDGFNAELKQEIDSQNSEGLKKKSEWDDSEEEKDMPKRGTIFHNNRAVLPQGEYKCAKKLCFGGDSQVIVQNTEEEEKIKEGKLNLDISFADERSEMPRKRKNAFHFSHLLFEEELLSFGKEGGVENKTKKIGKKRRQNCPVYFKGKEKPKIVKNSFK